jgi:hypothetical protein
MLMMRRFNPRGRGEYYGVGKTVHEKSQNREPESDQECELPGAFIKSKFRRQ